MQELQRRIENGEVQPKYEARLVVSSSDRNLEGPFASAFRQ